MTGRPTLPPWDAVVLAGGRSRRMGGVDKTRIEVAGRSLLDRALDAVTGAATVVVVGPPDAGSGRDVVHAREDPAGGGPLAAVGAALAHVRRDLVVVLAADLPFASGLPETVLAALVATPGHDAAVPVDGSGRRQPLAGAYRVPALGGAVRDLEPLTGGRMASVVDRLRVTDVPSASLPRGCLQDVDTPEDLASVRGRWTA